MPPSGYRRQCLDCCCRIRCAAQAPGLGESVELVDPKVFRVCADPHNLPFSDEKGEGFENKLAELFARKLNETTNYTYFPQVIGFVRNTLNALRCDVVMGTAVGDTHGADHQPILPHDLRPDLQARQRTGWGRFAGGSAAEGQAYRNRCRHAAGNDPGAGRIDGGWPSRIR